MSENLSASPVPTPHIEAKAGEIAKTVLMPGDPLRAKFIAENFLEGVVCFNQVRGALGFTGTYGGKKVSVMGSGMGMPSIGIYSYELYSFYGVENIIRIGTCGAYLPENDVYSLILASKALADSTFLEVLNGDKSKVLEPSAYVNDKITETATELGFDLNCAPIYSSDVFYNTDLNFYKKKVEAGAVAVEMEAFALFANAKVLNKNAACLLTVSDNIATQVLTTSAERQNAFTKMMELALGAAVKM